MLLATGNGTLPALQNFMLYRYSPFPRVNIGLAGRRKKAVSAIGRRWPRLSGIVRFEDELTRAADVKSRNTRRLGLP